MDYFEFLREMKNEVYNSFVDECPKIIMPENYLEEDGNFFQDTLGEKIADHPSDSENELDDLQRLIDIIDDAGSEGFELKDRYIVYWGEDENCVEYPVSIHELRFF
ncbi:MAG: hypothetical protein ACTSUM_04105 [Alphaproteobacteria bacterium]